MSMVWEYKYFQVVERRFCQWRGLPEYGVENKKHGNQIGVIHWYHPWRQFVLFAEPDTAWSSDCLTDVQDAIKKITEKHRKGGSQ